MYTGRKRSCTRYTAVYTGRERRRVNGPLHGRIRAVFTCRTHGRTAVYKVHGRVDGRLPCTCLRSVYTAVHNTNTAVYTARTRYTGLERGHVYGPCARPFGGSVRTVHTTVRGPCTESVHGHAHAVYTVCA